MVIAEEMKLKTKTSDSNWLENENSRVQQISPDCTNVTLYG